MMAGIRGKNTRPEIAIRHALHRRGLRYGLHVAGLPGKPDMVFRPRRAVIFVHGCFWHGHSCPLFRLPGTRPEFWKAKIDGNRTRDCKVQQQLESMGWRQLTIWECAIRGRGPAAIDEVADRAAAWLNSKNTLAEIRGP
jgi:DNA mismatch endonuclease (patch repair protein)